MKLFIHFPRVSSRNLFKNPFRISSINDLRNFSRILFKNSSRVFFPISYWDFFRNISYDSCNKISEGSLRRSSCDSIKELEIPWESCASIYLQNVPTIYLKIRSKIFLEILPGLPPKMPFGFFKWLFRQISQGIL